MHIVAPDVRLIYIRSQSNEQNEFLNFTRLNA